MANNRMFLRCKNCGSIFFIGKCYGDGYFTDNCYYQNGNMSTDLNEFYYKHKYCNEPENVDDIKYAEPKFVKEEINTENQFEIAYEFYREEDKNETNN